MPRMIAGVLVLFAAAFLLGCGGGEQETRQAGQTEETRTGAAQEPQTAAGEHPGAPMAAITDPVCGMAVDTTQVMMTSDYGGKTFYFCSESCRASFEADPAKYAEPKQE